MAKMTFYRILFFLLFTSVFSSYAQSGWYEKNSENFTIIYKDEHAFLADHILNSAEKALKTLSEIFSYTPAEKIVINTYDINDYGFASATTVPENFIRLEIEPFEPGYENIPYNERFQWILSHELVHIVLNDQASSFESISRTLFSKVSPEQSQPLTVLYSLLSNYSRYTPRWHQESSAVFAETWMSGGYGRISGSFDEMYFRSMVYENSSFPSHVKLDAVTSHNSFLLESLFYIYGGRFAAYLSIKYGSDKLVKWYKVEKDDFYSTIQGKFKDTFGADFYDEWNNFIKAERDFQLRNIIHLETAGVTPIRHILSYPLGWVTDPYVLSDNKIIFGMHRPHNLASIQKLDISSGELSEVTTLPSPSIIQVASVTYDSVRNFLFFTTNNNQLYRDVWVYDLKSDDKKELFPDIRIGHFSVAPSGDIWGIQHIAGKTSLILSEFPYTRITSVYSVNIPDELIKVNVSPDGKKLALVIHKAAGVQQLLIANAEKLKEDGTLEYLLISEDGLPENASWNKNSDYLFWNAYVNGVSNIYRHNLNNSITEVLSNNVRGLFRPVALSNDSLLVFEFSSEGFIPSVIPNKPASKLFAISYLGQEVIDSNRQLAGWSLPEYSDSTAALKTYIENGYNGFANIRLQAFVPVITGFQKQKVLGFFTRLSDPLLNHDITSEFGYSPFNENPLGPKFHFKLKYEYLKRYEIGIDHNATDFYDLFNSRKRGTIGTKIRAGYTNYWLYDNPHKIKQSTEIAVYTDFEYINDNLVKVTEPDFSVAQTVWNSKNLRRSIGSSDFESGDDLTATIMVFASDPKDPQFAGDIHIEWDKYFLYLFPHNVFHYKLAGGYHYKNERLMQAMFYFGGFGNRELENVDVKQYRSVFRFPGIPIYSLSAEQFVKVLFENNFPPIRFSSLYLGQHYLSHIDYSIYSQGLVLKTLDNNLWYDIGAQVNLVFKHWFNLESTLSAGIAKAWSYNYADKNFDYKYDDWEYFISFKLLKN